MVANAYLGEQTAIVQTILGGRKIYVDTRDRGIAPHLLLEGKWEEWITNAMSSYLRGATFFDVGANFGWYSLLAHMQKARKIVAFEPNPQVFELLGYTMGVNGIECDLHEKAVGEVSGKATLWVDPEMSGGSSCLQGTQVRGFAAFSKEVETVTLDEVAAGLVGISASPIVVKLDIEGYEPRAVIGAKKLFTSGNCVAFVEYHGHPPEEVKGMLDFFEQQNYQLSHVQHDMRIQGISREKLATLADAEMLCFRRFSG